MHIYIIFRPSQLLHLDICSYRDTSFYIALSKKTLPKLIPFINSTCFLRVFLLYSNDSESEQCL